MEQDEKQKKNLGDELLERLFGDPTDLSDEELELLYAASPSTKSPTELIYSLASQAAIEYRKKNLPLPEHLISALNASRPDLSLDRVGPSLFQKVVEKLKAPFPGPVADPAYAYRDLTELSHDDRTILEGLTDELGKDWEDEKDE